MTLLELLVKELPKRGGWPEGVDSLFQGGSGSIYRGGCISFSNHLFTTLELADDDAIVTREQYEAALSGQVETGNKVTRLDILTAINVAVSIKLDDAFELTETLMDAFDIKHK